MDLYRIISNIRTAEDFERNRERIDRYVDQFRNFVFNFVKTPEACQSIVDYCAADPHLNRLVVIGFIHYLRSYRVDYLRCFLPHINFPQFLADHTSVDFDRVVFALISVFDEGYMDVIELLLSEYGLDINSTVLAGNTILQRACKNKRVELIDSLINQGADVNYQTPEGVTATECAVISGEVQVVDRLIIAGANLDPNVSFSHAPITQAVRLCHFEIVQRLIDMRVVLQKELILVAIRQRELSGKRIKYDEMIRFLQDAGCEDPTDAEKTKAAQDAVRDGY